MDGAQYKPDDPERFCMTSCTGGSWVYGGHKGHDAARQTVGLGGDGVGVEQVALALFLFLRQRLVLVLGPERPLVLEAPLPDPRYSGDGPSSGPAPPGQPSARRPIPSADPSDSRSVPSQTSQLTSIQKNQPRTPGNPPRAARAKPATTAQAADLAAHPARFHPPMCGHCVVTTHPAGGTSALTNPARRAYLHARSPPVPPTSQARPGGPMPVMTHISEAYRLAFNALRPRALQGILFASGWASPRRGRKA